MFHLVYGLYKQCTQKDEYFILILGLDNAGKTTLLEQAKTQFNPAYVGLNPKKITATVGLNIGKVDAEGIRLSFWDLGGQEELQALWDKYYSECHAVIYVVDSSDTDRLEETKAAFAKTIKNQHLDGIPLLLLANKQDIQNRAKRFRVRVPCENVPKVMLILHAEKQGEISLRTHGLSLDSMHVAEIKAALASVGAPYIGRRECLALACSALNGAGVKEGIAWLVNQLKVNPIRMARTHL